MVDSTRYEALLEDSMAIRWSVMFVVCVFEFHPF